MALHLSFPICKMGTITAPEDSVWRCVLSAGLALWALGGQRWLWLSRRVWSLPHSGNTISHEMAKVKTSYSHTTYEDSGVGAGRARGRPGFGSGSWRVGQAGVLPPSGASVSPPVK